MSDICLNIENDELSKSFLDNGYVIKNAENKNGLLKIRQSIVSILCELLKKEYPSDEEKFLNDFHKYISLDDLNDLRLNIFNSINNLSWVRQTYFSLVKNSLEILVGNELAMQKMINLSIQLPGDDSSLLPLHADVWSGDSPFEVVVWVPLVDCYKTKSMFFLPPNKNDKAIKKISNSRTKSTDIIYKSIESDLSWLDVSFGNILIFSQNYIHGNNVNHETETRWSLNCRLKSLFSPYADKKLGEFFEPLTIRPVTHLGMNYEFPEVV